jgi:hypothetical protein
MFLSKHEFKGLLAELLVCVSFIALFFAVTLLLVVII